MKLDKAYIIDGDVIDGYINTLRALNGTALENSINSHIANAFVEFKKKHLKPALPIVEQISSDFAKWLKHNDNGDTHYNPETKETSPSIGLSPFDCFIDDTKTEKELFDLFKQDFLTKDF